MSYEAQMLRKLEVDRTTGIVLLLRSLDGLQNLVYLRMKNWRVTFRGFFNTYLLIYQQLLFIFYFYTGQYFVMKITPHKSCACGVMVSA